MKFELRSHDSDKYWLTDYEVHYQGAHLMLERLKETCAEVNSRWPVGPGVPVRNARDHPELFELVRWRDRLSDSARMFSAMSVEGFLNFYGCLRLGEPVFNEHYERLGLVNKLKALMLLTDGIVVEDDAEALTMAKRISGQRNALVHPKANEVEEFVPIESRQTIPVPEYAAGVVADLDKFMQAFGLMVPNARYLLPRLEASRWHRPMNRV